MMLFNFSISQFSFFFFLDNISIGKSFVLQSYIIIMLRSVCDFCCGSVSSMKLEIVFKVQMIRTVIPSWWIFLLMIMLCPFLSL